MAPLPCGPFCRYEKRVVQNWMLLRRPLLTGITDSSPVLVSCSSQADVAVLAAVPETESLEHKRWLARLLAESIVGV